MTALTALGAGRGGFGWWSGAGGATGFQPIRSGEELIVIAPFGGIGEGFVGFLEEEENLVSQLLIIGDIGMVLEGEAAEGLLNFLFSGIARQLKALVMILEEEGDH